MNKYLSIGIHLKKQEKSDKGRVSESSHTTITKSVSRSAPVHYHSSEYTVSCCHWNIQPIVPTPPMEPATFQLDAGMLA